MSQDEKTAKATLVQKKYTEMLLKIPHVMGVAVGMEKKNGAWESSNFDTARYKLRVHSAGVLGHFEVTRQPK